MTNDGDQKPMSMRELEARRKGRNLAIGLSLAAFVVLIFIITIVRLGPNALTRAL